MVLFTIVWIGIMTSMILLRNKELVIDWDDGFRVYIENIEEGDDDEEW